MVSVGSGNSLPLGGCTNGEVIRPDSFPRIGDLNMAKTRVKSLGDELKRMTEELSRAVALPRTIDFTSVNNSTQYTIVLALGQGLDESPVVDPPYVRDTGVTVCGTNVGPGTRQVGTIHSSVNVRSTRVRFSFHWRHNASGTEGDVNLPDQVAPVGSFYVHPGFGIRDPARAFRSKGKPLPPVIDLLLQPIK